MHHKSGYTVAAVVAAAALGAQQAAFASGFSLPEVSVAGIGTANALVANPVEIGAIPYNAAAMGFHDQSSLSVGGAFVSPSFSVTTASGSHDGDDASWVAIPLIQAAIKINDQWRAGLGVNAPFGLETRWQIGTFPKLSQTATFPTPLGSVTVPTGNHPTQSKLQVLDFVPTAAYRVTDHTSIGAGLDIYWAKTANLDSNVGRLAGDGTGLGFNLSALYQRDALSVGAAFRSAATLNVEGTYTPLSQALVAAGRIQPGQTAEVDVDLPWRVQVGVRYAFTDALAAEFDWTLTGWSEFQKLNVKGRQTGAEIFSDTNDWSDANAYRLGFTYQVLPATQLRFGYSYDETGQGDDYFSARVPDNDRQLFSLGVAQDLGGGLSLEAGYMYIKTNTRNYRSATPYTGGGSNGTDALDGNYEMDAQLVGIELVKVF